MVMRFFEDKVAVVTGAGSGIGRAVAGALVKAGANVILAGRREGPLQILAEELGREKTLVAPADVTIPRETEQLAQQAAAAMERIDLLFNCAGVFQAAGLGGLALERIREMMETNYMGIVHCLRAVIPYMQRQRSGHIVTMSSLAGKYPIPGASAYSATKYAVAGLSNVLRQELKHEGIRLTAVYPSYINTPLLEGHLQSLRESRFYKMTGSYSPEQAAKATLRAVARGKRELIVPRSMALTPLFYALCPGLMDAVTGRLSNGWPRYDQPEERN